MVKKKQKRRARRHFDEEFKRDVVRLCEAESIGSVAARLELTETSVRNWVKQTELNRSITLPKASTSDEKEELKLLRREVKRLREERDILKKATAFFAKESR
jgi:transposase